MLKNEKRRGYKKTKVGWIPEGWECLPFARMFDAVRESVAPLASESYREIGVRSHGKGVFHKEPITGSALGDKRVFRCQPHALVFNIVFAWEQAVAVLSEYENGFIASHRFPMFKGRPNQASENFYLLFFKTRRGKELLSIASPGGAGRNKTLGQHDLDVLPLPCPPLPEQEAIAGVLECWDRGIRALEKKIGYKRLLKKGLMQKLLSGNTRLPGFHGRWKTKRFLEAFEIEKGTKSLQVQTSEYQASGRYPVVDQGKNKIVAYTDIAKSYMNVPVIVFGDHTRIVKWIDFPFIIGADGTQLIKARKEADLRFGYFLISNLELTSLGYSRHLKLLKECEFGLPPLEEQRAIAAVLSAADGEIEVLERKLDLWKEQKMFLLNNLVTGTIRLPEFRESLP